jgi:hypothetical protein
MAAPITPTPILDEEEYSRFWDRVDREENVKVPLVPTPKLEQVREKILADAKRHEE